MSNERHQVAKTQVLQEQGQQSDANSDAEHDKQSCVVTDLQLRVFLGDSSLKAVGVSEVHVFQVIYVACLSVLLDFLAESRLHINEKSDIVTFQQ